MQNLQLDLSDESLWNPAYLPAVIEPKYYNLLWGGAGCFSSDQLVETISGPKKIKEIQVGDLVKSFNHKIGQYEFRPVLNCFEYPENKKQSVRIKLKDGTIIKCTADHKFFWRGKYVHILEILTILQNERMENNTGL